MKLCMLLNLAVILSVFHCYTCIQKDQQHEVRAGLGETYSWMIQQYIEELECSVLRSLLEIYRLIFSASYSLAVPPTKPEKLHISQIGSSWAYLQWESPSDLAKSSSVFSHYEIAVIDSRNGSGYVFPFNPMCINMSSFNITDLQHETLYEFSVTTVAETCGILARSLSSNLVHSTTKFLDRVETHPLCGAQIAGFQGATNMPALVCNVFSDNQQVTTVWNTGTTSSRIIQPLSQSSASLWVSTDVYATKLDIHTLASDLDNVIVYCGTEENPKLANFTLRIYRPPSLKDDISIKIPEHSTNVLIDLSDKDSTVFPEPQYYALKKDRHFLTNHDDINITLNSYSVLFQNLSRSHSGNYSMTIRNYELGLFKEVGTFTSTFEIDVLYGPEILPGVKKHYVLSGDPVSLICGYNLDSNPKAAITWTDPQWKPVKASNLIILDDGPMVVRLNISNASNSDNGTWTCTVEQDCEAITHIGSRSFSTELIVVDRPSRPYNLSIVDCGLTCIQLRWHQTDELRFPRLSHFEVTYIAEDGTGATEVVDGSRNSFNFTELILGKAYHFSVVAVSVAGDVLGRSPQSDRIKFSGFDTHMKPVPSSGTLLADSLGAENFTILNCSILASSTPVTVLWRVENFRNSSTDLVVKSDTAPELFYIEEKVTKSKHFFTQSHLTILNLTSDLDGVVVFCGTNEDPKLANFSIRVYYPPVFKRNDTVTKIHGDRNVAIQLGLNSSPFPAPSNIRVEKNGQSIQQSFGITVTNSSVLLFEEITIEHAGIYYLTATNYRLDNSSSEVGTCRSSLTLDVVYGPELVPGPTKYYVLSEHPVSLICGYSLKSHPPATVTWTDPLGNIETTKNDTEVIQFHIAKTGTKNNGTWMCTVQQNGMSQERRRSYEMTLTVVFPPGPPYNLSVHNSGSSWAFVKWGNPQIVGEPPFSGFEVTAFHNNGNDSRIYLVKGTEGLNYYNATGLEPDGSYDFIVTALSRAGSVIGRSQPSNQARFSGLSVTKSLDINNTKESFKLAVQCPSKLKNLTIDMLEGTNDVSFNLNSDDMNGSALAKLLHFSRTTSNSNKNINFSIRNATVSFENITKDHAGTYYLNLTYYCLDGDVMENRTEVGNLTLNVLYGPEMRNGSNRTFSLKGNSISLVCGYELHSNPLANITWVHPNGSTVEKCDRITTDNGPGVVQLNISNTHVSDGGNWTCIVEVSHTCVYQYVGGKLKQHCGAAISIGYKEYKIELVVIVPPSSPYDLKTTDCGPTCIQLHWRQPYELGQPTFSHYEVTHINEEGEGSTAQTKESTFNFSDLVPGKAYQFTVVAISKVGNVVGRSLQSEPLKFPGFNTGLKVEPQSGLVTVGLEGTLNFATLNCSIIADSKDISLIWSLQYLNGTRVQPVTSSTAPDLFNITIPDDHNTYILSHFQILNLTSVLDGVVVFCGTNKEYQLANFTFRVYRPPTLRRAGTYHVKENDNVTVNLCPSGGQVAFPRPHFISLQKLNDSLPVGDGIIITDCDVTFYTVKRRHSGNYRLHVANHLDNQSLQVGKDEGSFTLNVEYGPEIVPALIEYTCLENCPVSLVCGYNLVSHPPAIISWSDPQGITVERSSFYTLENEPREVRLNISNATKENNGTWKCSVTVRYYSNALINTIEFNVSLTVIGSPSEPLNVSVDMKDSSWLIISWNPPLDNGNPHLSHYELGFDNVTFSLNNVTHSHTFTGLSQSSSHNLTLTAISVFDGYELKSSQSSIRVKFFNDTVRKYTITNNSNKKVDCSSIFRRTEFENDYQPEFMQRSYDLPSLIYHQTELFHEKEQNMTVEFRTASDTLAEFSYISWEFKGIFTEAEPPTLVNSTILMFSEITREHNGVYILSVKNCRRDDGSTSTGRLKLDIQYGPEISRGPNEQYVISGDPVSLICGYNLESNPSATVTWTNPKREEVHNIEGYIIDEGPEVVRLNISKATESDSGVWTCSVLQHFDKEQEETFNVTLGVLVPPGKPSDIWANKITPKVVNLTWTVPSDQNVSISHYEVIFANESGYGIIHVSQTTNALLEELCYNSKYRFQVVAVVVAGNLVEKSPPSDPVYYSVVKPSLKITTEPENGTIVTDFEGSVNATTFICNIFDPISSEQQTTVWRLQRPGNVTLENVSNSDLSITPDDSHKYNQLTVRNLTSKLDGVTLYCGTEVEVNLASFSLRINRPPQLKKNLVYEVKEGECNVVVDLSLSPPPFPSPTFHRWIKQEVYAILNNTAISFDKITRKHAGVYSLTATNYHLNDSNRKVGTDTGNFTLKVIYGPEMQENKEDIYVLSGSPVSLVCGYNLVSNPFATVTWRDPQNKQVTKNDRYLVDDGRRVVQLNITKASKSDSGTWTCTVNVTSPYDSFDLVVDRLLVNNIYSETKEVEIRLTVIVPPSKPNNLLLTDMEPNSIQLQWSAPIENGSPIYSYYEAIFVSDSGEGAINHTSENFFNYTSLKLNRSYEFTVVAVSKAGDVVGRSLPSSSIQFIGFATSSDFHPPSGSVLPGIEGTVNFTTLSCVIISGDMNRTVMWSIKFTEEKHSQWIADNDSEIFLIHDSLRNKLTVRNLTSNLDGVVLYCGTKQEPQLANFTLRIYRPLCFKNDLIEKHYMENERNKTIDFGPTSLTFPVPSKITLEKEGQTLPILTKSSNIYLINGSALFFELITRYHAGNYTLTTTYYHQENTSREVGTSVGSLILNVMYGPELVPGPAMQFALLNDPVSLTCGYNLDSNPPVNISWTDPHGNVIHNSDWYIQDNGPEIVRLNVTNVTNNDNGTWKCNYGNANFELTLIVVVPPDTPRSVSVSSIGSTWIKLKWSIPIVYSRIGHYEITYIDHNGKGMTIARNQSVAINITGLTPESTYEFVVVAVSLAGGVIGKSQPSSPVQCRTNVLDFIIPNPPSGSFIADYEGREIALNCNRFLDGQKCTTHWSGKIINSSQLSYNGHLKNKLTILNLTAYHDGEKVYCGTEDEPELANFTLRIYRPPKPQSNINTSQIIGNGSLQVDLHNHSAAFPKPIFLKVEKWGQPLDGVIIINYFTVVFHKMIKENAGTYIISAANYHLKNETEEIGLSTTNLTLDILYGPVLTEGPREYHVLLGDSTSLICGYNLDSNPQAVITWIDPQQKPVANNSNYQLDDGPGIVQLNIFSVNASHNGIWKCSILVESDAKLIGNQSYSIQLNVLETPMPVNVSVKATGHTWVVLNWTFLENISNIKRLEVTTVGFNGTGSIFTVPVDLNRLINITNLDPEKAYDFTIMVVSDVKGIVGRSLPSYHVKTEPFPWIDIIVLSIVVLLTISMITCLTLVPYLNKRHGNKSTKTLETDQQYTPTQEQEGISNEPELKEVPGKPMEKLTIARITTKSNTNETEQSLAKFVKNRSQMIERKPGALMILKPPIERRKSAKGKRNRFSRCEIIGRSKPVGTPNEKILLLIGATGAGKSTLINGIVNYIMEVPRNDDFRFKIIVDEEGKSQSHSQTNQITAYSFHGSCLPYTLTVIDTPGFGDTRGIERDKAIVNQIKELFSTGGSDGIDQIHGIGFVIQASMPRLTPTQKYIFDSILSIFGKDIASNIFLLMTFADGQEPPVLSAIKEAAIPYQKGFEFNNSALYANQTNVFDEMFWNLGEKNFQLFFTEFEKAEAHSLQLTRETLKERQQLEAIVEGLKTQIKVGITKIDELLQKQRILRKREADILQNEHFTYELTVTKHREKELPSDVFVTNCLLCHFTCHYPCPIPKNNEKYRCKAMDGGGPDSAHCTVCPGNCPWSQHVNASHRFEIYYEVETQTSDDLKKNLSEAIEGKNQVENMIASIKTELNMLQKAVIEKVREAKRSLVRLQQIALKPNPLSEIEYIDLLINAEKSEKCPGYTERVKAYEIIKNMVKQQDAKDTETKVNSAWWKSVMTSDN